MLVFKELINCLLLLINVVMINMLMKKHLINIFFQKLKLKNTTLKLMVEIFMIKPLINSIKQYDETRKISTGQGDDITTGCLLDFAYFEKNRRLIAIDLSKQKALDADPKAIQQIIFTGEAPNNTIRIYYIYEQSKEIILEFAKGTTKVL